MVKCFDPRAEFATACPLEGLIQYDLRDRQQLILLHCCRQSETWHLKINLQSIWRVGLNWSADRMRPTGRSLATADVDYEEKRSNSTHPCRSPTSTVNGRDLTLPMRTQTSEQEYSDLTASNRRPSIPHSRNTPESFSRGTRSYAFSRLTKHVEKFLAYSQDFSKICWRVKFWSVVLWPG